MPSQRASLMAQPSKKIHLQCRRHVENPMDRGAWRATGQRVAKSSTWLSEYTRMLPSQKVVGFPGAQNKQINGETETMGASGRRGNASSGGVPNPKTGSKKRNLVIGWACPDLRMCHYFPGQEAGKRFIFLFSILHLYPDIFIFCPPFLLALCPIFVLEIEVHRTIDSLWIHRTIDLEMGLQSHLFQPLE